MYFSLYTHFIWLLLEGSRNQLAWIEFRCDGDKFYFHSNEITTIRIASGNWGCALQCVIIMSSHFTEQIKPWFLYYKKKYLLGFKTVNLLLWPTLSLQYFLLLIRIQCKNGSSTSETILFIYVERLRDFFDISTTSEDWMYYENYNNPIGKYSIQIVLYQLYERLTRRFWNIIFIWEILSIII